MFRWFGSDKLAQYTYRSTYFTHNDVALNHIYPQTEVKAHVPIIAQTNLPPPPSFTTAMPLLDRLLQYSY